MSSGSTPYSVLAGCERLYAAIGGGLTIAGQTVTPSCWFDGTGLDATAKTWTCRVTGTVLSLAGAGAEPDFAAESPVLIEKACKPAAGKYLYASTSAFDVALEDCIILSILYHQANEAATRYFAGIGRHGATSRWIELVNLAADGRLLLQLRDGTNTINVLTASLASGWGTFLHVLDRSGSGQAYANGSASGAAVDISGILTLSPAGQINIGETQTASMALWALYKRSAWLDTHLQPTLARRLHAIYCGQEAWDSSNRILTPTAI